ncbi:acyl-CoA N-acyltransferase [Pelagophyceae sp. CCMP2097]|nr:acyl-CoA N-acyltransferase [Pelagophyceae sp. CCMP2097]
MTGDASGAAAEVAVLSAAAGAAVSIAAFSIREYEEAAELAVPSAASAAFSIREYVEADAPQVYALFASGMLSYPAHASGGVLHDFIKKYMADAAVTDLADVQGVYFSDGGGFWCAVDERAGSETFGKIIGTVGGQALDADEVELRRMSVHTNSRGLGLATALLEALEARAVEGGRKRVVLSTGFVMVPAQKLYEGRGYSVLRREVFDFAKLPDGGDLGIVYYSKDVS